jgi:D-alanine-D-alanine ligase
MRVAVVHNAVGESDGPDAKDVLVQVETVCEALGALGHDTDTIACTLDLDRFQRTITSLSVDVVFNLVESLAGTGRLIHLVPFVLDAMGIPYTGSTAEPILITSNKVMAKHHMVVQDLPTPAWIGPYPDWGQGAYPVGDCGVCDHAWIIKSLWEHASIGLDETGIVRGKDTEEILEFLRLRAGNLGGACFAERFIDGREFNLSLLGGSPGGPVVLPPAEIVFEDYDEHKPRIVDFKAKWDETSFAFHHTPRRFDFVQEDAGLLAVLQKSALACWKAFGLRGYARVDFRVDPSGRPWVLEVNANPCLSPDAGFAAALSQGKIAFVEGIQRILDDSLKDPSSQAGQAWESPLPV